ncbi:MAG: hypothetical protein G01um101429_561 [Parcubacteria group bacterium Gr01-1014_29]|nr:MAG: hypothetical protein G01um101429_561 [Parcubacteria group bacterium Gr01-1014_29]
MEYVYQKTTNYATWQSFVVLVVLFVSTTHVEAKEWRYTLTTGVFSKYLVKPGFTAHNKPILVNDITISYGDNWYFGIWNSTGIFDGEVGKDFGDETDVYVGWRKKWEQIALDLRFSYFALTEIDEFNNDLWIFDGRIDFIKTPVVTPYVAIRYFGDTGKWSPKPGWFIWPGVYKTFPLHFHALGKRWNTPLTLDAKLAFALDKPFGSSNGFTYAQIGASFNIPIRENISLIPSLTWHIPNGGIPQLGKATVNKHQLVYGMQMQFRF